MNEKFKVKVVMVKGEQGPAGTTGDYSGLTNKPKINGVTVEGNLSSTDLNLIGEHELSMLNSRIDDLIVENTENASGFKIEAQQKGAIPDVNTQEFYANFNIPQNATILETSYQVPIGAGSNPIYTDNIEVNIMDNVAYVTVKNDSAPEIIIKIVYAYPESLDLSELEDIRVGYDGTVYVTAGTAVRSQIRQAMAGFKETVQQALLECFEHVGWKGTDGRQYVDALKAALEDRGIASISAVFDQGQNVIYDTDSLDTLKQYLTVTANYDDGTSAEVTAYTLSGTLTEGTSTITVSYGGKTATFTVNVTKGQVIDGTTLTWVYGFIGANGNVDTNTSGAVYTSEYYDVSGYGTALVALDGATSLRNAYYTANKTFIKRELTAESEIPSNAVYARATVMKSELGTSGYDGTGTTITLT